MGGEGSAGQCGAQDDPDGGEKGGAGVELEGGAGGGLEGCADAGQECSAGADAEGGAGVEREGGGGQGQLAGCFVVRVLDPSRAGSGSGGEAFGNRQEGGADSIPEVGKGAAAVERTATRQSRRQNRMRRPRRSARVSATPDSQSAESADGGDGGEWGLGCGARGDWSGSELGESMGLLCD